jgi:hypothetical protein
MHSDVSEEVPEIVIKRRFGLLHLMMLMALVAMLASVFARGERRVFALGYFLGAVFFPIALYGYMASLPYLLTVKLYDFGDNLSPGMLVRENFYIVAAIFWLQFTCITSGFLGLTWQRSAQ